MHNGIGTTFKRKKICRFIFLDFKFYIMKKNLHLSFKTAYVWDIFAVKILFVDEIKSEKIPGRFFYYFWNYFQ